MAYDQGSRSYPQFRSKFRSREDFNIYINNGKRCRKVWSSFVNFNEVELFLGEAKYVCETY